MQQETLQTSSATRGLGQAVIQGSYSCENEIENVKSAVNFIVQQQLIFY